MDQEQATEFVIRELGKHRSRDDIVREICEQTGWPWKKARHFVQQVEVRHEDQIVARQSPLLILLGGGGVVLGLALIAFTVYANQSGEGLTPLYALVGLGMIVGGIAGIWRTIDLWREAR
jgi:hypothetical protein